MYMYIYIYINIYLYIYKYVCMHIEVYSKTLNLPIKGNFFRNDGNYFYG